MARFSSLVVLVLLAFSPPVQATCAMVPLTTHVVRDAKVPTGGGLMVTTGPDGGPKPKGGGWNPVNAAWRFRSGGTLHVPDIELLAPGLAIYRLPKGVRSAELVDGKTVLGKLTVTADKVALLPAPKVKKLHQTTSYERKGNSTRMVAELVGEPPAGAVALVVADAKVARSYGAVGKHHTVVVYDHHPCTQDPTGTVLSSDGDQLRLYWLDQAGRASPATTVKLTATVDGDRLSP
jgi:hypothetical protein